MGRANALFGVLSAAFAGSTHTEAAKFAETIGPWAGNLVATAQHAAWYASPSLLMLMPLVDRLRKEIGSPRRWKTVHVVLDEFRERIFDHAEKDQLHAHRVTLFQYVRWAWCLRRWPWSGWLIPVERSGHTTQRTSSIFLAPDDADRAQGVAGTTWARKGVVYVKGLPDLAAESSDDVIRAYASSSWMPENDVRARRPRARSLCGIPVEVKGELWGVIVVDSRDPEIRDEQLRMHKRMTARFLEQILEGL